MLGLVWHVWACWTFSKISKHHYLQEGISFFYLLYVVTHLWKLQCYHAILVRYGPACPKLSEITNHQYLWKGLSDFVDFLHVVVWFLLDIRWSYKNMLFWVGIVRHRLSANQIVRCFKLKKLYEVSCYFGLWPQKNSWPISLLNFFTFDLFDLLILIPGSIATLYLFNKKNKSSKKCPFLYYLFITIIS